MTPKIAVVKDPNTDNKTNNIPFQVGEIIVGRIDKSAKLIFRAKISAPNDKYTINPLTGDDIGNISDYTKPWVH